MKNKLQKQWSIFFWVLVAADIAGICANNSTMHFIAKPLLVPALIILLLIAKTNIPGKNLLLTGLLFSWIGDLLLLLDHQNSLFFIFGLLSFLITHIFYILYFLKAGNITAPVVLNKTWLAILVYGYGALLVGFLSPHLHDLKIPVMAYAAVICTMLLCSLYIYPAVQQPANFLYVLGAALFILSDSLLAINKFYQSFPFAAVLIMLTYCAAQYFIVTGFIKQLHRDE